jgi:hypothetical protein
MNKNTRMTLDRSVLFVVTCWIIGTSVVLVSNPAIAGEFDSVKNPSLTSRLIFQVGALYSSADAEVSSRVRGTGIGMLVGRIVVEDDVDGLVGRHLGVDGVEEPDELLVPVALHVLADDSAVEHVEGGEQRGRAVSLVVIINLMQEPRTRPHGQSTWRSAGGWQ